MTLRLFFLITALLAFSCSSPRNPATETIIVEGEVTARGHEPFSAYVLETDEQNLYVLQVPDGIETFSTPARLRVRGRLFEEEWNGRPYAHIRISEWEPANEE